MHPFQISLQIDPFTVGANADIVMQTFDIEALLFLCSPDSLASPSCRLERKSATRLGLPIFIVHLEGAVPPDLMKRSYWCMAQDEGPFLAGVKAMAASLRARVQFHRKLLRLTEGTYFHEMIDIARSIAIDDDRTIVAEHAPELARKYAAISDPTTRYNLALALGRADTVESARLLEALPASAHPLEEEGKRQAREMMQNH